jgi:hypothetical protein
MTEPASTALDLLKRTEALLSALHGSVARHDNLGANLGCAGCELREQIRGALADAAVLPPPADRAAVFADLIAKAEEWDGHITVQELRRLAAETQPEAPTVGDVKQMLTRMRANASTHDLDYLLRLIARWVASSEGRDVLVDELAAAGYPLPSADLS